MVLAIATNNAALQAAASASSVNRDMETSMARLSTGKRINAARDDAAGVAIASRLAAEIRGTDQAIRNAIDGQALIDTVEGGHKEIENVLQRMREVSVQAANDTNDADDRANLQAEIKALITEVDRIASVTTWAGQTLMSSTGSSFSFQVGTATGSKNQIEVQINAVGKTALGISGGTTATTISAIANGAGVAVDTATGIMTLDWLRGINDNFSNGIYAADIEGQTITGGTWTNADSYPSTWDDYKKVHRDASAADFVAQINANSILIAKGIKAVAMPDTAIIGSSRTAEVQGLRRQS
jgi:flagellin-like hook-associated protein FlgL